MATKKNTTTATPINFTIKKHLSVLRTSPAGWTRELNIVQWEDAEPKFDIRDWAPDHKKFSKGLSFTSEEMLALSETLTDLLKKAPAKSTKKAEPKTSVKKAEPKTSAKKAEPRAKAPAKKAATKAAK